ncbi:uncharacterized protein LOC133204726 [Saccostrea echinata]|uniref:uncharacterized protein LOC133204726 n=1 Tax=Saccostrea echinata TaxID=191078 RepID=UPI002A82939C|nr:uncharacterized protein LOC133204726 [Saccostrea echinata]
MISFILLLLVISLQASYGDTCEERLSKLERILEKLEQRSKSQFAEHGIEYGVFGETSLKNKRQRLENKGLRREKMMQKRMNDMEMFLEIRLKTFEDKMVSDLQKVEENLQEKLRNMEEKLKDFNNQKIMIKVLEARIAELEVENKKHQSFDEGLKRKNESVLGNTGNGTSIIQWRKIRQRKSLTSAQKRLLTGIQPTSSPFPDVVAFSSYVSTHETHLTEDHTIKFDKIVTNIGNHYNPHSGLFTAPQHGVYVFSWNLYCATDGYIFSQLVVNSNVVGAVFTSAQGAGNIRASTWIVVVEVNKDDVVYIRTHPTQGHSGSLYSHPDWRSSFNGWKLN